METWADTAQQVLVRVQSTARHPPHQPERPRATIVGRQLQQLLVGVQV